MVVLAGLGNPGREHAGHRHNIGFMLLDRLIEEYGLPPFKEKKGYELTEGRLGSEKALLVKPMRYMNCSGAPLHEVVDFYKIPLDDVIVIHDDIDLAPGKVRVKQGGGHGGHNGLRDIDRHLGKDYRRLRIGVGRSPHANPDDKKVDSHVLSNFTDDERAGWVDPLLDCIARHIDLLITSDDTGTGDDTGVDRAAGNAFVTTVAQRCPAPKPQEDDHGI